MIRSETRVRQPAASDIRTGDWVDRLLPPAARPYARLARFDRPIGIWLLLFPCWWAVALASPGWPDPVYLLLFAIGAAVMRGAGCVMNDIADRDFDRRVARTAGRPLASGAVGFGRATGFMVVLSLIGLAVLLQFNRFTVVLATASLILVAVYPFAKRVTDWPQAVLGLTFNWGALVGWSAVTGDLDWPAVLLYAAGVFWTLGYDTIYAHQDKTDDLIVGVRSTALRLGDATRRWLAGFYGLTVILLAAAGWSAGLGWPFAGSLALTAGHFAWQAGTVRIEDPKDCLVKFRANRHVGWIVFAGIVLDRLARS
jgi:4-hydroxybenzoate polyprenyltransferase